MIIFFIQKWRRRYFVLYAPPFRHQHNHDSASTVLLEYYNGPSRRRKRGTVDLEHCEEVISELESATYRHVFALRTRSGHDEKTYLIAAKTEYNMNQWVDAICQLLGMQDNSGMSTFTCATVECVFNELLLLFLYSATVCTSTSRALT